MSKTVVYYAHPKSYYGTEQEKADIAFIVSLYPEGVEVINPATLQEDMKAFMERNPEASGMDFFTNIVAKSADVVIARGFNDGCMGAGVVKEILEAWVWNKPVGTLIGQTFDPPSTTHPPMILTIDQTRARIAAGCK